MKEKKSVNVNQVEKENSSGDELFVATNNKWENKDWFEKINCEGLVINFKLDSGAQCNVIPYNLVENFKNKIKRLHIKKLVMFKNTKIKVMGDLELKCKIKNKYSFITFKMVDENVIPILGKQTCEPE